jgi:AraC family transcriptional regulator
MTVLAHARDVTVNRTLLAQGCGWQVSDVTFRATSAKSRFESRHDGVAIAAVTAGSFRYRSTRGCVTLMPGALLLGNAGDEFACAYDETWGDRCISFSYTRELFERIAEGVAGAKRAGFRTHRVAPTPATIALTAAVEIEQASADPGRWEGLALRVAGDALSLAEDEAPARLSERDERRVINALDLIEAHYSERLSVGVIAEAVHMSPYHFLRVFRAVVGVTPHQYVLRTRLRRTAIALAMTEEPIATIAFAHGFGDLSTFVTTFGRVFGHPPRDYRRAARVARSRHGALGSRLRPARG